MKVKIILDSEEVDILYNAIAKVPEEVIVRMHKGYTRAKLAE